MKYIAKSLLVGALLVATIANAAPLTTERYTLPNGLTVLLQQDKSTPKVTVNFLVKVGSKDEPEGRSGFAHLFEHLMFMGTKRVPRGQYDKILESYGGDNNAFTAPDMTLYYSSAPAKALPTMLWLEADRLEALGENITQEKLDLQRQVVLNERRQTTENTPYGEADEAVNQLLYPPEHPYHRGTIGSPKDLNAASVADVQNFFKTYYVPNNISLLVAGSFDTSSTKKQIAQLFGSLPRSNDTYRKPVPARVSLGEKRVTMVDRVSQPRISMTWRIPKIGSDTYNKLDVLSTILRQRINEQLLDAGIANDADIYVNGGILESTFTLYALPADKITLGQLEQKMNQIITAAQSATVSSQELQTAIASKESSLLNAMQDIVGRAQTMNIDNYYYGDPNYSLKSLDSIRKLKTSDLQRAAKTLAMNDRLILIVLPSSQADTSTTRDTRPNDANGAAFAFPKEVQFKLANGITVSYWQFAQFPLTYINVISNQGSGNEPIAGSSDILAKLLDKGSKTADFKRVLAGLGAQISSDNSPQSTNVLLKTLSRNAKTTIKLLGEAVRSPLMTNSEFALERDSMLIDRESLLDQPNQVGFEVAMAAFHGQTHAYGRFVNSKQIKALKLEQIKARYAKVMNPANTRIFIAGSLDLATAKKYVSDTFGSWHGSAAQPMPSVTAPAVQKARLILVDRPDAPQTDIRVLMPSVGITGQYLEQRLLCTVLGGTFTSRLNANLREDKGYTYGIGAQQVTHIGFGFVTTHTAIEAAVTGAAIQEMQKEYNAIASSITQAEFVAAQQTMLAQIYDTTSNAESLILTAGGLWTTGYGFDRFLRDADAINKLSRDKVNALSNPIDLNHAIWVLVGDKKSVLPQLEKLGLPAPEILEINP